MNIKTYFVAGSQNCERPLTEVLEEALQAGITMFQYREKGRGAKTGEAYEALAIECQALCRQYNVPFIVNDDVELALALQADGIHVGQDDAKIDSFRTQAAGKIVGVSVHSEEEMAYAVEHGADYVGVGPVYTTYSKENAPDACGPDFIATLRQAYPHFQIVAIGGITPQNVTPVWQAGATGIAVVSAISKSQTIDMVVRALQ